MDISNKDAKSKIVSEKEDILINLLDNVTKITKILKKGNPYKILSDILSYFKSLSLNIETELDASTENIETKFTLEFVQMLLLTINISDFMNEDLEESEFFEIVDYSSDIFYLNRRYLMSLHFENKNEQLDKYGDYIFIDFLRTGITGKRYDIFEVIHHIELLSPLNEYFEKCYGFDIKNVFDGIEKLKYEFTFGLMQAATDFNDFMDDKDIKELTEEEEKQGQNIMLKLFGLELHNVNKITGWTEEFISVFSSELGEKVSFFEKLSFESIVELHFEINEKPLIKINDDFYCLQIQRFLDNFDRILIKDMCKKLFSEAEVIRSILSNTTEIITGKLLKKVLPNSNIYHNNYYKDGSKFIENDLLIEYDKNLLVIEVKSGSFTPYLAIKDMDSHLKSLNKLIEEADSQSDRFVKLLEQIGSLTIYGSNKKGSQIKKIINYDDYDNIFKFVITLDGFNEIEARAEKLGFLHLNKGIVVLSIDDLRAYSDYFSNSPSIFLHYLKQRVMATECKAINLNDELDHLGLYIAHNTYGVWADKFSQKHKTTSILWSGYREEIDRFYNQQYLKINEVKKPVQEIPNRIKEIILFCEDKGITGHTHLISLLLSLEPDIQRKELNQAIDMMIKFFEYNQSPKYAHFKDASNGFITCIYDDLNYNLNSLYIDAYANMVVSNIEEMTIAFLYYDKKRKLEKVKLDNIRIESMPYYGEELNLRVTLIKSKRVNEIKQKRKIGRNELCPCGSGLKYKKCCLNN